MVELRVSVLAVVVVVVAAVVGAATGAVWQIYPAVVSSRCGLVGSRVGYRALPVVVCCVGLELGARTGESRLNHCSESGIHSDHARGKRPGAKEPVQESLLRDLGRREAKKTTANTEPPKQPGFDQSRAVHKRMPCVANRSLTQAARHRTCNMPGDTVCPQPAAA